MSQLNEEGSGQCTKNDDHPVQTDHEDGSSRGSELSQESDDQEEQVQAADLAKMTPLQIARAKLDLALRDLVERSMLENALEALRRMHEVHPQPNVSQNGEASAQEGAPGPLKRTRRPPTKRAHKKPLRLEPDPDSGITKIREFHVDLTQFNESSSLYEMCRSWIKDKPLNVPEQDQDCKVADKEMDVDSIPVEDRCGIYTLPAPLPAPKEKNLRIASPVPRPSEEFFVASDDSETVPVEDLLGAHKKHWKNVREKCVRAAMANEERYKESLAILQDASQQRIRSAQPPQQPQDRI